MGVALSHSRLLYITQRKSDLQLRIMLLNHRHQLLANKSAQKQSDIMMAKQYLAMFNSNASALSAWKAENPGVEPSDADYDLMPEYQELPAGYDSTEEIMGLANNAELDLFLINQAEVAIQTEQAQLETELAAINQEEESIKKLRDKGIKDTFGTFGSN